MEIALDRFVWRIGAEIGRGGFGLVCEASSSDFDGDAVAKFVPKVDGAEREMLFGDDLDGVRNVVPVLDRGETDDDFVLVMPRADKSLSDHIEESDTPLSPEEVVTILQDVVAALEDLDGRVVHRDLKPGNVLYLDGTWCLADFGIARYAENSTSADTRKYALSAPYSAPERWRFERATTAVDVYSVGVMAFEMLTGERPFPGPTREDFREQHLHEEPPGLPGVPQSLAALVGECLFKAPEARPRPANVATRLARPISAGSPAASSLQAANLRMVELQGQRAVDQERLRTAGQRRSALADAGASSLDIISEALHRAIEANAPAASIQVRRGGWQATLGDAALAMAGPEQTQDDPWAWEAPAFEVVAHSSIAVSIPRTQHDYEGRSHSLWYCDAVTVGQFRWYETAFMVSAWIARQGIMDPFALDPGTKSAKAVGSGMNEFQVAWPFTELDGDSLDDFVERWIAWFAEAAMGQLNRPSHMPERHAEGTWRT